MARTSAVFVVRCTYRCPPRYIYPAGSAIRLSIRCSECGIPGQAVIFTDIISAHFVVRRGDGNTEYLYVLRQSQESVDLIVTKFENTRLMLR
jgi:hypothetical protein